MSDDRIAGSGLRQVTLQVKRRVSQLNERAAPSASHYGKFSNLTPQMNLNLRLDLSSWLSAHCDCHLVVAACLLNTGLTVKSVLLSAY